MIHIDGASMVQEHPGTPRTFARCCLRPQAKRLCLLPFGLFRVSCSEECVRLHCTRLPVEVEGPAAHLLRQQPQGHRLFCLRLRRFFRRRRPFLHRLHRPLLAARARLRRRLSFRCRLTARQALQRPIIGPISSPNRSVCVWRCDHSTVATVHGLLTRARLLYCAFVAVTAQALARDAAARHMALVNAHSAAAHSLPEEEVDAQSREMLLHDKPQAGALSGTLLCVFAVIGLIVALAVGLIMWNAGRASFKEKVATHCLERARSVVPSPTFPVFKAQSCARSDADCSVVLVCALTLTGT
jgi:hypothetical protein